MNAFACEFLLQPQNVGADATIGEFLAEVERTSSLKPKTFRRYAQCLRRVAAHIRGVKAYKLFLLCMCAGLRRGEADVCLWSQLRPEDCSIREGIFAGSAQL